MFRENLLKIIPKIDLKFWKIDKKNYWKIIKYFFLEIDQKYFEKSSND